MRVRINWATKYVLCDLGISMDAILMFRFKSRGEIHKIDFKYVLVKLKVETRIVV